VRDVLGTPHPPYVHGDEEKLRWNCCALAAAGVAFQNAPDDPGIRSRFVVSAVRACYRDPSLVVDDAAREGFEESLAEARKRGIVPSEDGFY
jgi:hypothetical protein